jgi:hypothetical protein
VRSVGSPLEAVAAAFAERATLLEAITTAVRATVWPLTAALVHADVARSTANVVAVGCDGSHDAAAEDETQQSHGHQLGGAVSSEAPRTATADGCRRGDRCRGSRGGWCGLWCRRGWFCR